MYLLESRSHKPGRNQDAVSVTIRRDISDLNGSSPPRQACSRKGFIPVSNRLSVLFLRASGVRSVSRIYQQADTNENLLIVTFKNDG